MVETFHYDLDTDSNLGGNDASDYVISSQKALKTYIDSKSIFIAEYGVTTYSDIKGAVNAGKNVIVKYEVTYLGITNTYYYTLISKVLNLFTFINIHNLTVYVVTVDNSDNWNETVYTAVNKSGDTMTGDLTIARSGNSIAQILKSETYEAGTTPSETITHQFLFRDKNDKTLGYLSHHSFVDGVVRVTMNCRNQDASANEYLAIGYTESGNVYTHAPTPAKSSNDTNIATTAFVKNTNHGEWVIANHTIMEAVSLNGSTNLTYNLSSYLPNDGNIYEVLITGTVTSNANSQVDLQVSALTSYMYVAYSRSVTNNTITGAGTSMLLAKSNTPINVRRDTNYNGTARLYCRAYRRVTY